MAAAAIESVKAAQARAVEALERSAEAHEASARAHERAAVTLESFGRVDAAARHRVAAIEARAAARRDYSTAAVAQRSAGKPARPE